MKNNYLLFIHHLKVGLSTQKEGLQYFFCLVAVSSNVWAIGSCASAIRFIVPVAKMCPGPKCCAHVAAFTVELIA